MKAWRDVVVRPDMQIRNTIEIIDASSAQIALVADRGERLLGTVTDGDIRRGILRGISLEERVDTVMNRSFTSAAPGEDRRKLLELMKLRQLRQIPIVDGEGVILGLETLDELLSPSKWENVVVIMAGGLGTRLKPLTNSRPKPMLEIGGRPILETIVRNISSYGFHKFYFSVNYMADVIREHFGDGSAFDVSIGYIQETERLGTAGALSLLPVSTGLPTIVMNGDLLTKLNLGQLMDFHVTHDCAATMCVREYDFQVPYGVLKLENHKIAGIEEKPVHRFFVNAGIYVLEDRVLQELPKGTHMDMPELVQKAIHKGMDVAAFPIREYWLDIGHPADFDRAESDYGAEFL